jgi:hypothetical protein
MRILFRRLIAICAVTAMVAACGGSSGDDVPLVASTILNGHEQVPANASNALGSGTVTVDRDSHTLIVSVFTSGVVETAVHLHNAAPGFAGPVLVTLGRIGTSTIWAGSATLSDAQWEDIKRGNFYLDVHSAAFPVGELRGQLFEDAFPPDEHIAALLQVAPQSPLLAEQLDQLDDYEDWWHDDHSGLDIGLVFRF